MDPLFRCHIIGVDPGLHTGICHLELWMSGDKSAWPSLDGHMIVTRKLQTTHTEIDTLKAISLLLTTIRPATDNDKIVIVCEHFVFTRTSMMGGSHLALEMTGALKALKDIHTPDAYLDTVQKPSEAKLIQLETLRQLGIITKGDKSDDHAHMAARHALIGATRVKKGKILV